jgi:hypothetical protein
MVRLKKRKREKMGYSENFSERSERMCEMGIKRCKGKGTKREIQRSVC